MIKHNEKFIVKYKGITHICQIVDDFFEKGDYSKIKIFIPKKINLILCTWNTKKKIINDATWLGQKSALNKKSKYDFDEIKEICKVALDFYYTSKSEEKNNEPMKVIEI